MWLNIGLCNDVINIQILGIIIKIDMFLNLFLVFIIHDCWMTYIYVYSRIKQRMF